MSRTSAGAHDCVAAFDVMERFANEIEPVNEDSVRAEVRGKREMVVGVGDDAVCVWCTQSIGNWSAALVMDDRHRRRKKAKGRN